MTVPPHTAPQSAPTAAPAAGPLGRILVRHPFWITFLTCLVVLVLRDPGAALYPPVMVEDAVEMLSFYHANADPTRIFRFYNGYTSVGPNILGYLAGLLPVRITPYVLHWGPILIAAATFAAIQIRGVAFFGLGAAERFAICVGLCLLPLANWALVTNTTYSLWNILILSAVLLVFWQPAASGPVTRTVIFAGLLLASWSHPLFLGLGPLLVLRVILARDRGARIWFAAILAVALAYPLLGFDISGRPEDVEPVPPLMLIWDSARLFLSRGLFETVFSSRLRTALTSRGFLMLTVAVGAVLLAALGAAVLRYRRQLSRTELWQMLALLLLAGAFTAGAVASGKTLFEAAWGQRYTYPAGFLTGLLGGWALVCLLRAQRARRGLAGLALLGVWIIALNGLDWTYYRTDPAEGQALHGFVQAAAVREAAGQPFCLKLDRGRWSVVLDDDGVDAGALDAGAVTAGGSDGQTAAGPGAGCTVWTPAPG